MRAIYKLISCKYREPQRHVTSHFQTTVQPTGNKDNMTSSLACKLTNSFCPLDVVHPDVRPENASFAEYELQLAPVTGKSCSFILFPDIVSEKKKLLSF